jgi:hypothetical protein
LPAIAVPAQTVLAAHHRRAREGIQGIAAKVTNELDKMLKTA